MPPVAFLCGACKRPLWVGEDLRETVVPCGACGASCRVPADVPTLVEAALAEPVCESPAAGLVDLAALPVLVEKMEETLENKGIQPEKNQLLSVNKSSGEKTFPWLLLWMTVSFSILSAILSIYLVLRLRAADEALRKRAISTPQKWLKMADQKRGRINDLVFG